MNILSRAATATVKSKIRLWIEYALIIIVIVLGALSVWFYVKGLRLEVQMASAAERIQQADERVAQVELANEQQQKAISTLREVTDISDTMLEGLNRDLAALRLRDQTVTTRLTALERTNELVRQYLHTAVPEPVGCVLDHTCPDQDRGAVPQAEQRSADTLPTAKAGAEQDE